MGSQESKSRVTNGDVLPHHNSSISPWKASQEVIAGKSASEVLQDDDMKTINSGERSAGAAGWSTQNLKKAATDGLQTMSAAFTGRSSTSSPEDVDHVLRRGLASMCRDDVVRIRKQLTNQMKGSPEPATGKWVILPGGRKLTYWRSFMILIVLLAVAMAPFELAFDWWEPTFAWKFVGKLVDSLCIFDMGINFFIGYVKHGRLITNHFKIGKHYCTTWFIIDFLSNFPWDWVLSHRSGKSRKIVKLLKLPKIIRITRLLRVVREEAHYVGPLFTVSLIVIMAHYASCIWASLLIDCNSNIWNDDSDFELSGDAVCPDVLRAYTEGFSVGMAALSGTDSWTRFSTMTSRESAFTWEDNAGPAVELAAAAMCVVGLCTIAVLFGNIAKAIERKDSHSQDFNARLHMLKAAVHQYAIPHDLYVRVRKHYHYMWNCGVDTAKEILHDKTLSVGLRRQLAFSFYGNWLRKVPFLSSSQEALLQRMAECVDTECFSPEDPIIVAGESGTELYFLVVGRVMIITRQGKLLRVLDEGSFFGEMGLLFPETCRTVNVVAHTFGWLLVVSREALEDICSEELLDVFRNVAQERFMNIGLQQRPESPDSGGNVEADDTAVEESEPLDPEEKKHTGWSGSQPLPNVNFKRASTIGASLAGGAKNQAHNRGSTASEPSPRGLCAVVPEALEPSLQADSKNSSPSNNSGLHQLHMPPPPPTGGDSACVGNSAFLGSAVVGALGSSAVSAVSSSASAGCGTPTSKSAAVRWHDGSQRNSAASDGIHNPLDLPENLLPKQASTAGMLELVTSTSVKKDKLGGFNTLGAPQEPDSLQSSSALQNSTNVKSSASSSSWAGSYAPNVGKQLSCGVDSRTSRTPLAKTLSRTLSAVSALSRAYKEKEKEPAPEPQASLKVSVISARNLRNADGFMSGLSDPYCIIQMEDHPETQWRTHVVSDDLNPTWNCTQRMQLGPPGKGLEFVVMDKDDMKKDDELGRATLPSAVFMSNGFEGKLPLRDIKEAVDLGSGKDLGEIRVCVRLVQGNTPGLHYSGSMVEEDLNVESLGIVGRRGAKGHLRSKKAPRTSGLPSSYRSPSRIQGHIDKSHLRPSSARGKCEDIDKAHFDKLATRLEAALSTWGQKLESRLDGMEDELSEVLQSQRHLNAKLEKCLMLTSPEYDTEVSNGEAAIDIDDSPPPLT